MPKLDPVDYDSMVEKVCRIPIEFTFGKHSVNDLLLRSGYLKSQAVLTVDSVESRLRHDPELANAWLRYSQNKRTSGGWYLSRVGNSGQYELGAISTGERLHFENLLQAAAEFVVREVKEISAHMPRQP